MKNKEGKRKGGVVETGGAFEGIRVSVRVKAKLKGVKSWWFSDTSGYTGFGESVRFGEPFG